MKISTDSKNLLDTNILIEAFRGTEPTASLVKKWIKEGNIAISVITVAEFLVNANKEEKEKLSLVLTKFAPLAVEQTIAEIAAEYRREYSRKSKRVYLIDCLIAATAKLYNLTLVTKDTKDYPMKDIKIINP
ncbi:MAG: hypothetical protein ACD_57C00349G0004 [uncultured bacterium]|nr:MAG: hypothetical protein ACD_57C00349G0004 [uncultured bacterium]